MRETRLYDFANLTDAASFARHHIVVPKFTPPSTFTPGTWAGLAGDTLAWRVETGDTLLLENLIARTGFRLSFSAPLSCRPLLAPDPATPHALLLVVACRAAHAATLVRLRVDPAARENDLACCEIARCAVPDVDITAITAVADHVVVACSDGRAAVLPSSPTPGPSLDLRFFSPSSSRSHQHRSEEAENTSMVSQESSDSIKSNRSIASSMSFSLINRLFATPQGAHPGRPYSDATMDQSQVALSTNRRESRRSRQLPRDGILALARASLTSNALFTLHQSGRICLFIFDHAHYQFAGDITLPGKLSNEKVDQFLLTGQPASAIAVVMVDEDPSADSLRVYNIAARINRDNTAVLSCTQIVKRNGPVGRIKSAVFTGHDIVVGTHSGALSGLLNISAESDSGSGIPTGTIWTAVDDVDKPFGLGRTLDEISATFKSPLLVAHRFSPFAVAKALRNPDPAAATRQEVAAALNTLQFPDDEENMWKRVKARAEHITKLEDMKIHDVSFIDKVGIVVARQASMYILRSLCDSERKAFGNCSRLLNERVSYARDRTARTLSSHGACQVLASQLRANTFQSEPDSKTLFMLGMCCKFSENRPSIPLTDILLGGVGHTRREQIEVPDVGAAIIDALSVLEPGPRLLKSLLSSSEMEPLTLAAEQSADTYPISSMFASGVSWLAIYRKASLMPPSETRPGKDEEEALVMEDDRLNKMLEKAYEFLVTATRWCDREDADEDDDAQCAIALSSMSHMKSHIPDQGGVEGNVMMTDSPTPSSSSQIPNGPSEKLERKSLGFWLLERSVRLLESSGAPKSAAAAALEAMERAPDRKRHEMMRSAAFSRFLDAGELEHALTAILHEPFTADEALSPVSQESGALRDALSLFVNAAADRGMLQWLTEYDMPEPLRVLCGHALERRARAADPLRISDSALRKSRGFIPDTGGEGEHVEEDRTGPDYEMLFSWHISHGDESSAATAALEWAERLSREGLGLIRGVINGKLPVVSSEQKIRVILMWVRSKLDALTLSAAACQLETGHRKFVARSRFSILSEDLTSRGPPVVKKEWISRRQLLAHAQSRCLTRMISDCEHGTAPEVHYLFAQGSPFLEETREGVAWAVSMLGKHPSFESISLSVELCRVWVEEIGDGPLVNAVRTAAETASRTETSTFTYAQLEEVLSGLISGANSAGCRRNWRLIALEGSLATSGGATACPQWLVDSAAWGTTAFKEGTVPRDRRFSNCGEGDATGVVKAFLRYNRPTDAARVLLSGLAAQKEEPQISYYVPYAAIDSTLEILAQLSDDFADAEKYHEKLMTKTKEHLAYVSDSWKEKREDSAEMSIESNEQSSGTEHESGAMEIMAS